jgi:hypothetical protein
MNYTTWTHLGNKSYLTDMNFTLTNSNTTGRSIKNWGAMSISNLITLIVGLIGNGGILLPFIWNRSLRTPFNIYLINLLVSNIASIVLRYPLIIYSSFKWSFGHATCTFSLYGIFIIGAVAENAHLLIGVNRLWAVIFPISYRSHHSVKTAVFLCAGMWLYVHLIAMPIWLMDAVYYRKPVEIYGCFLNAKAQAIYNKVIQIIIWMPPPVGLLVTFIIIHLTRLIRRRRAADRRNAVIPMGRRLQVEQLLPTASNLLTSTQLQPPQSDKKTLPESEAPQNRVPIVRQKSHGHLVLILLTISTTICWFPLFIYYVVLAFSGIFLPDLCYQIFTILASCQVMLDPLLFTFALKSLRDSLCRFII